MEKLNENPFEPRNNPISEFRLHNLDYEQNNDKKK